MIKFFLYKFWSMSYKYKYKSYKALSVANKDKSNAIQIRPFVSTLPLLANMGQVLLAFAAKLQSRTNLLTNLRFVLVREALLARSAYFALLCP